MKGFKRILSNFDSKELKKYLVLSVLIIASIIVLSNVKITEAKYTSEKDITLAPNFAFFIVDVSTQMQTIRLDNIVPRATAYSYTFSVSNFKGNKKANVDLTYSIEVVATTNLPLNIKLYQGSSVTNTANYVETVTQNEDDVYFRHLLFNGISTMNYNVQKTDTYLLTVEFPESYKSTADGYAGVIELIDIEIRAEQVVST